MVYNQKEYSGFLKILQAQILQKIGECEVEDDCRNRNNFNINNSLHINESV